MRTPAAVSTVALALILSAAPASAQTGAFDFLDPCKKAGAEFASTSDALRGRADGIIAEWDARTDPPENMRSYYVEALKEGIYHSWSNDPATAELIEALGDDFDARAFFFEKIYPKVVTPEIENDYVRQLYQADYQASIRPKLVAEREKLDRTIAENKEDLDDSCKTDLFNQFFRVTFGNAFILLSANAEAAKREPNIVLGAVRLFSGVSISDIAQNGLLGGENSELRKLAEGIAGGENSELRKLLRSLDPGNWSIDLPKLPKLPDAPKLPDRLPDLPNIPLPRLPKLPGF